MPQITCLHGVGVGVPDLSWRVGSTQDVVILGVQKQGKKRPQQDIPKSPLQPCSVLTTHLLLTYSHLANGMAPGKGTLSPLNHRKVKLPEGPEWRL